MEIFLGGTCNNSTWRDALIKLIECDFFNPIVDEWTEEAQQLEIHKRNTCDYILYVITPKMTGVYSIAESVYDACTRPEKTIFCVLEKDDENEFTEHQLKSLNMTKELIKSCNAIVCDDLIHVSKILNYLQKK